MQEQPTINVAQLQSEIFQLTGFQYRILRNDPTNTYYFEQKLTLQLGKSWIHFRGFYPENPFTNSPELLKLQSIMNNNSKFYNNEEVTSLTLIIALHSVKKHTDNPIHSNSSVQSFCVAVKDETVVWTDLGSFTHQVGSLYAFHGTEVNSVSHAVLRPEVTPEFQQPQQKKLNLFPKLEVKGEILRISVVGRTTKDVTPAADQQSYSDFHELNAPSVPTSVESLLGIFQHVKVQKILGKLC